jgi:Ankyrin repeats (3 copies)
MTSKERGQDQDNELLDRYRRASATEAAAPSDAVRAAILAEGRRVAEQLADKTAQPVFDSSRPAANDSRWKIPAFGTLGAALLAALLIAPRYWQTLPEGKVATAQLTAPTTNSIAPSQAPAIPPPAAASESLQEVVVTQANRRRTDAAVESSRKAAAKTSKDELLANAPVAAPQTPARADAAPPVRAPLAAARSADSASYMSADRVAGARSAPSPARLQSAAEGGDLAQASTLLDQGAAADARDAQGRTPLLLAITHGRLEVVRLLLQRGADPNIADNSGKTPLQQATEQNRKDIADLLRNAGAH